jgi:tripartite-type tricarboxylate transporter receptor subunit TctC
MKAIAAAVIATAALLCTGAAQAEVYPSHPLALIVPFPAGGPTDTLARIITDRMRVTLGQPIVIENVTGAGATIGVGRAVNAAPDGYTFVLGNWTSHVGPGAIYKLPYDVLTDLAPISMVSATPLMIVGKTAIPADDGKGLIAWLKANPNKASAATVGVGSAAHVCMIYFRDKTGTQFQMVPYRGGAPAMQDMVAGQIDLMCAEASQTLPYLRGGKMKAFAVMSKSRWPAAPDVATMDEVGVPGMDISFWNALWTPKGIPNEIIAKLNAAVVEALADPTVRQRLTDLGHVIATREEQTPQALAAFHRAEIEKWFPIIKAANIKPE